MRDPDDFKKAHLVSDVDRGPDALHHSLGKRPNQSAPGNHKHDLDYASKTHTHPDTDGVVTGDFKWSAGTQDVAKWVEAGTEVSRSGVTAALYALFGTSGGVGNGTTTFVLPSVADRFIVGASGTKSPMTTGGSDAASVVLTEANLPPHPHGLSNAVMDSTSSATGAATGRVARGTGTSSGNITPMSGFTGDGTGTSSPFNVPTVPKYLAMKGYWKT